MSNDKEPQDEAEQLTDELARKYDPERLLKIISLRAGRGEALEHSVRAKYEKRFGVDLGHVRVYSGEFAEAFNRKRNAYAVTIGSTGMILMGGSPDKSMASASGHALLAHELTHVAQAQGGMHRKATSRSDMPFGEEHEVAAHAVEDAVEAELKGVAAGNAMAAKAAAKEALAHALERIRDRVFEMAADSARNHIARNGVQRRP